MEVWNLNRAAGPSESSWGETWRSIIVQPVVYLIRWSSHLFKPSWCYTWADVWLWCHCGLFSVSVRFPWRINQLVSWSIASYIRITSWHPRTPCLTPSWPENHSRSLVGHMISSLSVKRCMNRTRFQRLLLLGFSIRHPALWLCSSHVSTKKTEMRRCVCESILQSETSSAVFRLCSECRKSFVFRTAEDADVSVCFLWSSSTASAIRITEMIILCRKTLKCLRTRSSHV